MDENIDLWCRFDKDERGGICNSGMGRRKIRLFIRRWDFRVERVRRSEKDRLFEIEWLRVRDRENGRERGNWNDNFFCLIFSDELDYFCCSVFLGVNWR